MKKIGLLTLLIMGTLLFALAFTVAAGPRVPVAHAAVVVPVPATAPAAAAAPPLQAHPHIHASLEAMHHARHELEVAAAMYDGHRGKAIEHLDAAIREAEICDSMP